MDDTPDVTEITFLLHALQLTGLLSSEQFATLEQAVNRVLAPCERDDS